MRHRAPNSNTHPIGSSWKKETTKDKGYKIKKLFKKKICATERTKEALKYQTGILINYPYFVISG